MSTETPTFLTLAMHEGRATLGGKRRLLDDFDEASDFADEIDGQVFALEPIESAPFTPMPAISHVRIADDLLTPIPALSGGYELQAEGNAVPHRMPRLSALEPWRFILVATSLIAAVPVGILAAQPVQFAGAQVHVWNGADLAVLLVLAVFVSAFLLPSRRSR